MFGLGTWEILLILVAALIFIGPDKLPGIAKSLGKGVRQIKNAMSEVDDQVNVARHQFREATRIPDPDELGDPTAPDGDHPDTYAAVHPDSVGHPEPFTPDADADEGDDDDDTGGPRDSAPSWHARPPEGRVAAARPVHPAFAARRASIATVGANTDADEATQTPPADGDTEPNRDEGAA